jgi:leucyl/phenylalanyl-tRNA--protein transferase
MRLYRLSLNSLQFPAPTSALHEPNGLLAFGGDLSPERLLTAYRQGIFPWYSFPDEFHVSRSFQRFLARCDYRITLNHAFAAVVAACAERGSEGTWIGPEVEIAYQRLHELGQAHSIEIWDGDSLIGGMYGVVQGALFCGESMFSRKANASKLALLTFCRFFRQQGGKLVDCQVLNSHTASLGAREIPRSDYLARLGQLQLLTLAPRCWQPQTLSVALLNGEPDTGD